MRVVHISTADWLGGAARAAYRLHAGLQRLSDGGTPVRSSMLVASRVTGDPSVLQFRPSGGMLTAALRRTRRWRIDSQLAHASRSRPNGFEPFNGDRSAYQRGELIEALPGCDLVNLHWVSELIDYSTFLPQMCAKMPVVWTLHDMNVLTGGCHYDDGCGLHERGCGSCPQLGSSKGSDLASHIWKRKRKLFASLPANRLHVVAPSRWLADAARSSPLLGRFNVMVIPYGLDT
ncbi:MAG TPA: hypothetical protein VFC46_17070, partial [Humisphaera sp.]|nr:hypothetical protein [Humisphaera sp.]